METPTLDQFLEDGIIFEEEHKNLFAAAAADNKAVLSSIKSLSNKPSVTATDIFNFVGLISSVSYLEPLNVSGSLSKLPLSNRKGGRWKTRHFQLEGNVLSYYAKETDVKPKGQIIITPDLFVRDCMYQQQRYAFELVTPRGVLRASAETKKEKQTWVSAISRVIHSTRSSYVNHSKSVRITGSESSQQHQNNHEVSDTKTGFLEKLAIKSRRNWKRRYFVLYRNLLSYYEQEGDNRPKGDVLLDPTSIVVKGIPDVGSQAFSLFKDTLSGVSNSRENFCFHIVSKNQTLILRTTNEKELEEWVEAMRVAIRMSSALLNEAAETNVSFGSSSTGVSSRNIVSSVRSGFVRTSSSFKLTRKRSSNSENMQEFEVIVTQERLNTSKSIGTLKIYADDTLSSLRSAIYYQLDKMDLPDSFNFLRMVPGTKSIYKASKEQNTATWLGRQVENNFTKVTNLQEEVLTAKGISTNNGKTIIIYSNTLSPQSDDDSAIASLNRSKRVTSTSSVQSRITEEALESPINKQQKNTFDFKSQESIQIEEKKDEQQVIETTKSDYVTEINMWKSKVKQLEGTVADLRCMIQRLQQSQNAGSVGVGVSSSPIADFLYGLQKDQYLSEDTDIRDLVKQYKKQFTLEDLSELVIRDQGNAFKQLVSRYCHDPEYIRKFMDKIQDILKTYTISKGRLTEAWWSKTLKKADFLKYDNEKLDEWAQGEPWCDDTPERYAYLMTKMRGKGLSPEQMVFIKDKPNVSSGDSDDDADDEPILKNSTASADSNQGPCKPKPSALLGGIQSFDKTKLSGNNSKPASLLSGIQKFDKTKLSGNSPKPALLLSGIQAFDKTKLHSNEEKNVSKPAFLSGINGFDKSNLSKTK